MGRPPLCAAASPTPSGDGSSERNISSGGVELELLSGRPGRRDRELADRELTAALVSAGVAAWSGSAAAAWAGGFGCRPARMRARCRGRPRPRRRRRLGGRSHVPRFDEVAVEAGGEMLRVAQMKARRRHRVAVQRIVEIVYGWTHASVKILCDAPFADRSASTNIVCYGAAWCVRSRRGCPFEHLHPSHSGRLAGV
jgi:hypothetical protein